MSERKKIMLGRIPAADAGMGLLLAKGVPSPILARLDGMVPKEQSLPGGAGFEFLKGRSAYPVEQRVFPKEMPAGYPEEYPCSDGGTIWIPVTTEDFMITFLLHETGHCLLHYPNGPDIKFEDPERVTNPRGSRLEAEACAVAYLVSQALGLPDLYNRAYLQQWTGNLGRWKRESESRVLTAATRLINQYVKSEGRHTT